ncbi:MAG: glycosyl transferase family 1 [Bacteroidetes bacterium GWF2_40_14]|nr:MAG: glycosyl transferase family 1 [Bacteroidetes bacterium GWF2_40_14]
MGSIKVLEVIRQGQIGGGESHLIDLISGFGPDVSPVVLAFTPGHMIDYLREAGVKCYVMETKYPFDIRALKGIKEILLKEKIEIIHSHGSRAASNMLLIARLMKIPMVYTVHGWSFHQDQSVLSKTLRILVEKLICLLSRKVICVSESNRITGVKAFGLNNATVIENGISFGKFNPYSSYSNIREEFGILPDDFVVGFIGRITIQKDPVTIIKAVELAHAADQRIKALIIGDGDLKEQVMQYIDKQILAEVIYTDGFRKDIPDLLSSMDVFCQPSLWEGLSISLLEAMAMKKALVVTPTDGTSEIISDGVNGSIAAFGDVSGISERILEYCRDREKATRHGENAFQLVKSRFDSSKVSEGVTGIYRAIISAS